MSIPASSATCERVFSSSGQVCSKRRGRLSPKRIEELTVIKINHKKIEDFKENNDISQIESLPTDFLTTRSDIEFRDGIEEEDLETLFSDDSLEEDSDSEEDEEADVEEI